MQWKSMGFSVVWTLLTFNMRVSSVYRQDIDFGWTIPLKKSQCFIYKWAGSNVSSVLCFMHVLMFACSSVGSWKPFIFSSVWVKWAQFYIWMNLQRSSSTPSYLPAFVSALHTLLKNESRHSVFITISQWPVGCVWVNQSFLAKTIYRTSMSVAVGSISLFFSFLSLSSPILFFLFSSCLHNLYSFPPLLSLFPCHVLMYRVCVCYICVA